MSKGLEARGLTVRYKDAAPVFSGLSLTLENGKLLALVGPSGCGKTTLLNVLAGAYKPQEGTAGFDGKPIDPKSLRIGLMPQNGGLFPWKTLRQNCLFLAGLHGMAEEPRLLELCTKLGIAPLLDRFPATLSGGQAQRAALARVFLARPELLLMDEPFAALDAAASHTARALCLELWRESGATAVVVTHRLEDALFLGGEIMVLGFGGKIFGQYENPSQGGDAASPQALALLGEVRAQVLHAAEEAPT